MAASASSPQEQQATITRLSITFGERVGEECGAALRRSSLCIITKALEKRKEKKNPRSSFLFLVPRRKRKKAAPADSHLRFSQALPLPCLLAFSRSFFVSVSYPRKPLV